MYFIIVQYPEVQAYMECEGFDENSYLINDEKGIRDYGPSAYFISVEWLNTLSDDILK